MTHESGLLWAEPPSVLPPTVLLTTAVVLVCLYAIHKSLLRATKMHWKSQHSDLVRALSDQFSECDQQLHAACVQLSDQWNSLVLESEKQEEEHRALRSRLLLDIAKLRLGLQTAVADCVQQDREDYRTVKRKHSMRHTDAHTVS